MSVRNYYIMQSAVEPMQSELPCYTPLTNHATSVHVVPLVMAADYARLEQECKDAKSQAELFQLAAKALREERDAALKQVDGLREALEQAAKEIQWIQASVPMSRRISARADNARAAAARAASRP